MFRLLLVQVLIALASGASEEKKSGARYANVEGFNFHVAIFSDGGSYVCAGSIISPFSVLTAAQCTQQHNALRVHYGSSFRRNYGENQNVTDIHPHPEYNPTTHEHDIALLTVSGSMIGSSNSTGVIPLIRSAPAETERQNRGGYVTGWGQRDVLDHLLFRLTTEIDRKRCSDYYKSSNKVITESMLCFADQKSSPCEGDEGSPLVVHGEQAGVLSWGYSCDKYYWPVVYTDVLYHKDFIDAHILA